MAATPAERWRDRVLDPCSGCGGLSPAGGVVYLYRDLQDAPVLLDAIEYAPASAGTSFGRRADATGNWTVLPHAAPGRANHAGGSTVFRRGDANANRAVDVSDAVFVLAYLFLGGQVPSCLQSADANDNGALDITDPIYTLNPLFLGGQKIPPPFPGCGAESTPDPLGCDVYAASCE